MDLNCDNLTKWLLLKFFIFENEFCPVNTFELSWMKRIVLIEENSYNGYRDELKCSSSFACKF